MDWNLQEAVAYYRTQGAPGDQTALVSLLSEVQRECSGLRTFQIHYKMLY